MFLNIFGQASRFANDTPLFFRSSFVLLLIASCYSLQAAYPVNSIPYGLTLPTGTLSAGEVVSISVWAGDSTQSLAEVVGFDLQYQLTEHATFFTGQTLDLSQSWLSNSDEFQPTATLIDQTLTLKGVDPSQSSQGYGALFTFELTCNTHGVTAAQMISIAGGGTGSVIIQVDDISFRQAAPLPPSASIYPNPSAGKVFFKGIDFQEGQWTLHTLQGQELGKGTQFPINLRAMALQPGRYLLRVLTDQGTRYDFVLVFAP